MSEKCGFLESYRLGRDWIYFIDGLRKKRLLPQDLLNGADPHLYNEYQKLRLRTRRTYDALSDKLNVSSIALRLNSLTHPIKIVRTFNYMGDRQIEFEDFD